MLFEQIPFECEFFLPRSSLNGCTLALMDGSPQCIAALSMDIHPFLVSLLLFFSQTFLLPGGQPQIPFRMEM